MCMTESMSDAKFVCVSAVKCVPVCLCNVWSLFFACGFKLWCYMVYVCIRPVQVSASWIIIHQFYLNPLVYYSYRILSGQISNFINGSIQTDSHFFLYCFIHRSTFFTLHNFHLLGFSISPFPFTPPIFPVFITAFVLFDTETLSYPILKLYPWSLHLNNPSPPLRVPLSTPPSTSILTLSYFNPLYTSFWNHTSTPPRHPTSTSLPLLPMRIHNLSPVAWTPTPQFVA